MEKSFALMCLVLLGTLGRAQTNKTDNGGSTVSWVKNIPTEDLIQWRRHIHQNPELSFKEEQTSKYVEDVL